MDSTFFTQNRQKLFATITAEVAIFTANASVQRANDASYAFAQEANFWYLTGIDAAQWWVIIEKERTTLVAPDVDEVHRIFDGSLSNEEAQNISGADAVVSFVDGEKLLTELCKVYSTVATLGDDPHSAHYDFVLNPGPVQLLEKLTEQFETIEDVRRPLAKLRAIKQPVEIEQMRRAIDVTIAAFETVKQKIDAYENEYEIEADFSYAFRNNGAPGHAYDPIVAMGKNACTLHYGKNQQRLDGGSFVLLDIGANWGHYAADITRTYAHGIVSDRHKAVHAAVEKAHQEIIALIAPGLNVRVYFEKVDQIMKAALQGLGLLNEESDYRKYFPHSIGHGLGIDVHDALGAPEIFEAGMVMTVEPGIYIPEEGIGIRIEDDVLITETGYENLSAALATGL